MDYKRLIAQLKEKFSEWQKKLSEKIPVYLKFLTENPRIQHSIKGIFLFLKVIVVMTGIMLAFFILPPVFQELAIVFKHNPIPILSAVLTEKQIATKTKKLERANAVLYRKLTWKTPQQPYLIVNSTINEFFLYRGKNLVREGKCSTGSYIMLQAADERKWIFQTPRGVFRIQGKITSPVWIKPDWAFIEEGLPVPSKYSYDRYEYGVLGDYAMSLGHGYLIHGTLYQRFLGMPVTHGCIRLGDEDLKAVYRNLDVGSKVFIY